MSCKVSIESRAQQQITWCMFCIPFIGQIMSLRENLSYLGHDTPECGSAILEPLANRLVRQLWPAGINTASSLICCEDNGLQCTKKVRKWGTRLGPQCHLLAPRPQHAPERREDADEVSPLGTPQMSSLATFLIWILQAAPRLKNLRDINRENCSHYQVNLNNVIWLPSNASVTGRRSNLNCGCLGSLGHLLITTCTRFGGRK